MKVTETIKDRKNITEKVGKENNKKENKYSLSGN